MWDAGYANTVDLLGEKTLTLADRRVRRRFRRCSALAARHSPWRAPPTEQDPWGTVPRINVSVKANAPHHCSRGNRRRRRRSVERLPILEAARAAHATIHLDTEHDELKDATYQLLREVGARYPEGPQLGCVVQAYRVDAVDDLGDLIEWSADTLVLPLQIRLVKGAYWDIETIRARAQGWKSPVWPNKDATDASYEACASMLVANAGDVRPAFASHNARSIAWALCAARAAGLPDDAVEVQVLHGMAEPLHGAVRDLGVRTRVYVPVGDLVPGMAYLVRRLLENTSNESPVRHRFHRRVEIDTLIAAPTRRRGPRPPARTASPPTPRRTWPVRQRARPSCGVKRSATSSAKRSTASARAPFRFRCSSTAPPSTPGRPSSVDPAGPITVCRSVRRTAGHHCGAAAVHAAPKWRATS